jgi:ADP-ribose pyrophosphatase YjhB (NUDIX family)
LAKGGLAGLGFAPSEVARKEAFEAAGVQVTPIQMIGVLASLQQGFSSAYHTYSLLFYCRLEVVSLKDEWDWSSWFLSTGSIAITTNHWCDASFWLAQSLAAGKLIWLSSQVSIHKHHRPIENTLVKALPFSQSLLILHINTEDVRITELVVEAGRLLDIDVLDHLIIGRNRYVSLKERGLGFG